MSAVASRYARAFADVVLDGKLDPKQVTEQLDVIVELYRSNSRSSPRVGESGDTSRTEAESCWTRSSSEAQILRPVRNFVAVLIDHGRIRRDRTDCAAVPGGVESSARNRRG